MCLGSHQQTKAIPRNIILHSVKIWVKTHDWLLKSSVFQPMTLLKNMFFLNTSNVPFMLTDIFTALTTFSHLWVRERITLCQLVVKPNWLYHLFLFKKKHLCWQFAVCVSCAALYISLFAGSDSDSTNSPVWQTCGCQRQIGSTVLVKQPEHKSHSGSPLSSSFSCPVPRLTFLSLHLALHYKVWKWTTGVTESCCFEGLMPGFCFALMGGTDIKQI